MARLVASWFGSGLLLRRIRGSDVGSGTVGALLALPISLIVGELWGWPAQLAAAAVVASAAVVATREFVVEGDPGWIVVDEAAGTFVATIGLAVGPALVAFVVFRLADVTKRTFPGVALAERIPGTVGITADDVVAGVYGLAAGHIVQAFL